MLIPIFLMSKVKIRNCFGITIILQLYRNSTGNVESIPCLLVVFKECDNLLIISCVNIYLTLN